MHFAGRKGDPARGWALCISGPRALAIRLAGRQTYDEARVTCARCRAIIAMRAART